METQLKAATNELITLKNKIIAINSAISTNHQFDKTNIDLSIFNKSYKNANPEKFYSIKKNKIESEEKKDSNGCVTIILFGAFLFLFIAIVNIAQGTSDKDVEAMFISSLLIITIIAIVHYSLKKYDQAQTLIEMYIHKHNYRIHYREKVAIYNYNTIKDNRITLENLRIEKANIETQQTELTSTIETIKLKIEIQRKNIEADFITKKNELEKIAFEKKLAEKSAKEIIQKTEINKNEIKQSVQNLEAQIEILKHEVIPTPIIEPLKLEIDESIIPKHIGYNPINVFAQTEPFNFPYVLMPKHNNVIKFPRKGKVGRKGYKEKDFKNYIDLYFTNNFQIFDDRFMMVKNNDRPYEPDFTLIDEKDEINLFIDIEIDEPYEGLNNINNRKPTHNQYADTDRNNAFTNRGWIVIRFAEIQVHQEPIACCRFLADVIKSINSKYIIPAELINSKQLKPIKQWTKEESEVWSYEKYRENYLGIQQFGITIESALTEYFIETELDKTIEDDIIDELYTKLPLSSINSSFKLISRAINSNLYLSFSYQGKQTITKPIRATANILTAFCYIKNLEQDYSVDKLFNLLIKDNYFTSHVVAMVGADKILNIVSSASIINQYIKIKYLKPDNKWVINEITGIKQFVRQFEESIRTLNDVQFSIHVLSEQEIMAFNLNDRFITAYCNKRSQKQTFSIDRIAEIEILDL